MFYIRLVIVVGCSEQRYKLSAHRFQQLYHVESEEVRHGDVTAGVKRVWNVITVDKYIFFHS